MKKIKKWLLPLQIRMTAGIALLFITGLVIMFFIVSGIVRNLVRENVNVVSQNGIQIQALQIDKWFALAANRLDNLVNVFQALPDEEFFDEIAEFFSGGDEEVNFFIGLSDGRIYNGGGKLPTDWLLSIERPWYLRAIDAGPEAMGITEPFQSHLTGNLSVAMSKYVPDLGGIGGVVGTSIPLTVIRNLVLDYQLIGEGYFILVDNAGRIIVHPRGYMDVERDLVYTLEDIPGAGVLMDLLGTTTTVQNFYDYYLGKSKVIVHYLNSVNWNVIGIIPNSILQTQVNDYTSSIIGLVIFVLFSIFIIVTFFVTKISTGFEEKKKSEKRFQMIIAQLEEATLKAKASNEAKSNFLSNMSHEIRTPMNAICGMAEIGHRASDIQGKNYAIERIQGASKHLLGIINDVLDVSKIESGKFEMEVKEFEFERIMRGAVDIVESMAAKKWQRISIFLDPEIPQYLLGDEQKLTQVMTNLLANAVKFTPVEGQIHLEARVLGVSDLHYKLQVEVNDTGMGISKEARDKIFEPFEQENKVSTMKTAGTGLGLTISKQIIEFSGGKIWVESNEQEGSTFIFTIELQAPPKFQQQNQLFKGISAMVISDELKRIKYFKGQISKYGGHCVEAVDLEAVLIENTHYDIYFVDVENEQGNGMEFACRLKKAKPHSIVTAMLSPYSWVGIDMEHDTGVDDFMLKPIFPSKIRNCILQRVVSAHQASVCESQQQNIDRKFESFKILVADDIELNQEIVSSLLKQTGAQIEFAKNGLEAIEKVKTRHYDLLFMDLHMPQMDGLEATRKIREMGYGVPIIAMTADVFQSSIDKCKKAGMEDYVSKPLDIPGLLEKMDLYLSPKQCYNKINEGVVTPNTVR